VATAYIISVGNELLSGLTVDTNAAYLAGRLAEMGIAVAGVSVVPDDEQRIAAALEEGAKLAEVVLVTGGLGPTDDDVTRQGLARWLGVELVFQPALMDDIEQFFRQRQVPMPQRNRLQAYLPAGAESLRNEVGTAPGVAVQRVQKCPQERLERGARGVQGGAQMVVRAYCMPGVPSEMRGMFETQVRCRLGEAGSGEAVVSGRIHCFGAGESAIAEMLGDRMARGRNPLVNTTVSDGVITLHVVARGPSSAAARAMMEAQRGELRGILGDLVFGRDGETLGEAVGRALLEAGKTIAVAESCTGGLVCKLLTDVPGASRYFLGGWVTYSNEAKTMCLGVDEGSIERHGAVSEEVAEAMARGASTKAGADVGVGITGIAGPDGGTEQKPVGLVYICVGAAGRFETVRRVFGHSRGDVRQRAAWAALNMARLRLRN